MAHPPFTKDFARQAHLFRQGRERWKRRCAAKQNEIRDSSRPHPRSGSKPRALEASRPPEPIALPTAADGNDPSGT